MFYKHFELSWIGDIKTCKAGHEEEITHTLEELEIESDVINSETVNFKVTIDKGRSDYNSGYQMCKNKKRHIMAHNWYKQTGIHSMTSSDRRDSQYN